MNKIYIVGLFIASLAISKTKAQDTLNINGGFEKFDIAPLVTPVSSKGWIFQASSGEASYKITGDEKHSGQKAAYLKVSQVSKNYWDIQIGNEDVKAPSGHFYRASFWAKSPTKSTVHAVIGNYDYAEITTMDMALTTNWTKYSLVCFNNGTSKIKKDSLRVIFQKFEKGEYYFDDIVFTQSVVGSLTVVPSGDSILVNTGIEMEAVPAVFENSSFSVKVNGVDNVVKSVSLKKGTSSVIVLKLTIKILPNDKVYMSHTGGKLAYANPTGYSDANLAAFADSVDNFAVKQTNTRIINSSNHKFNIYPNPSSDVISIDGINAISELRVISTTGQLILKTSQCNSLSVSALKSGYYIVNAIDKDGVIYSSGFIKR